MLIIIERYRANYDHLQRPLFFVAVVFVVSKALTLHCITVLVMLVVENYVLLSELINTYSLYLLLSNMALITKLLAIIISSPHLFH